jgi:hypothetical protein
MYIKFPIYTKFCFKHFGENGDSFLFSTDFKKIGSVFDVSIQNGTGIDIISDTITLDHPKYGFMSLIKIKADIATDYHTVIKEFWIPIDCVVDLRHT